jgi:hypothetical protein
MRTRGVREQKEKSNRRFEFGDILSVYFEEFDCVETPFFMRHSD